MAHIAFASSFIIDDFDGDSGRTSGSSATDNTINNIGLFAPSPIDDDNTVMNTPGGGDWSRHLYAELLSGEEGEKVTTVVCYGCDEGHAVSDPGAEGHFDWIYTGSTFDASKFEYFTMDYLDLAGRPIEPGGVVELYFDGVLAAQSDPLPGEETSLMLPLLISDNSVSNVTIRIDGVEGLNANPDNAKLVTPLPKNVFGTSDDDLFDTENPDDKQFLGAEQNLFASSGDDTVDVTLAPGGNRIDLGSGDDTLFAGTNNRILAGSGDDTLFVGSAGGNNVITGGSGMDQFWIVTDEGDLPTMANIITDFTSGEDVIGLGSTSIGFADLTLTLDGNETTINGLGQDLAIVRGDTLSESDFFFA